MLMYRRQGGYSYVPNDMEQYREHRGRQMLTYRRHGGCSSVLNEIREMDGEGDGEG